MKLTEKVNAITTREHFVSFVQSLADDFKRNPSEWENDNLLSFLSAVAAWVDDMDGYYKNQNLQLPQQPDWKLLGKIFLAAKVYE